MASRQALPVRAVLRRSKLSALDVLVAVGLLAVLYGLVRLGRSMTVDFTPGRSDIDLSTSATNLPDYAAGSLLRMFLALAISFVFTFAYGTAAARLRRTEKVLVPLLDILQSVPILVFLPVALTFFVNLFPGSLFGFEAASIFVIFTSQAWNMTFSFYHSLITQPPELDEAARMYRLTKWQRFWKLDVLSSMIGLVWNAMMSIGGGWFFLAASEAVTVFVRGRGESSSLPGIGSYMAVEVQRGSISGVGIAIGVMVGARRRHECPCLPATCRRGRRTSAWRRPGRRTSRAAWRSGSCVVRSSLVSSLERQSRLVVRSNSSRGPSGSPSTPYTRTPGVAASATSRSGAW